MVTIMAPCQMVQNKEFGRRRMSFLFFFPSSFSSSISNSLPLILSSESAYAALDIGATMLNAKGEPRKDIFVKDMLHMNDTGYRLWTAAVRPVLVGAERAYETQ